MPNLNYSNGALNVYSAFFGAEKMLYVEGDDDLAFWDIVLSSFNIQNIQLQEVGGDEELAKYILKIKNNEIDAIAAKDCDFSILEDDYEELDNVLVTYGHSIENTLICPNVMAKVIKSYGRVVLTDEEKKECENWLNTFYHSFNSLIKYDAVNELRKTGLNVLYSNCSTFMKTRLSPLPCDEKITTKINLLGEQANFEADLVEVITKIDNVDKGIFDFLRGHFLFSAALRYINYVLKSKGSQKTASNDALFSGSILALEGLLKEGHPHYHHYENQIKRIL
ncbi:MULTISPECIES: DUF4435 domain-containing protein [unclassified Pseudoalteromonas]|uniref:DUF4435 domain-containing protein n=1 Tax=unclassified Pseudoalteromonas TaxID=194690 RepID=UPI0038679A5B